MRGRKKTTKIKDWEQKLMIVLALVLLVSCGVQKSEKVSKGASGKQKIEVIPLKAGEECEAGGRKVQFGFDKNNNQSLEKDEMESEAIICDGQSGKSGDLGDQGKSCQIKNALNLSDGNTKLTFECNGKESEVILKRGEKGEKGSDGKSGKSCQIEREEKNVEGDRELTLNLTTFTTFSLKKGKKGSQVKGGNRANYVNLKKKRGTLRETIFIISFVETKKLSLRF